MFDNEGKFHYIIINNVQLQIIKLLFLNSILLLLVLFSFAFCEDPLAEYHDICSAVVYGCDKWEKAAFSLFNCMIKCTVFVWFFCWELTVPTDVCPKSVIDTAEICLLGPPHMRADYKNIILDFLLDRCCLFNFITEISFLDKVAQFSTTQLSNNVLSIFILALLSSKGCNMIWDFYCYRRI